VALGDELGAVQCAGDAVWAACCRREVLARPPTHPHNTAWRCGDVAPGPARPGRVPICGSTPQYVVTSISKFFSPFITQRQRQRLLPAVHAQDNETRQMLSFRSLMEETA
jgi:hypothetical protein